MYMISGVGGLSCQKPSTEVDRLLDGAATALSRGAFSTAHLKPESFEEEDEARNQHETPAAANLTLCSETQSPEASVL